MSWFLYYAKRKTDALYMKNHLPKEKSELWVRKPLLSPLHGLRYGTVGTKNLFSIFFFTKPFFPSTILFVL